MSSRTRTLAIDPGSPDPLAISEAARVLRSGGLVAFATETVYGLGADATNPEAVARIFEAKGRPSFNPLIVHVHDLAMARTCVSEWPERAERLSKRFWPGPLTLLLPRSAIIPDNVTAGRGTVGVRMPASSLACALIEATGRPIAAPSANRSTGISPTEAWHVQKDLDGKIDMILDGGKTNVGIESTVLDLSCDPPRVLRPGSVTVEQLSLELGEEVLGPGPAGEKPTVHSSPGQMLVHYAPTTTTYRVERSASTPLPSSGESRWGLITLGDDLSTNGPAHHIRLRTPAEAEAGLYASLHDLDSRQLDFMILLFPPDEPEWLAIRDRAWRASKPWPDKGHQP